MLFKLRRSKKRLGIYKEFETKDRTRETVNKSYTYGLILRELYRGEDSELINQVATIMSDLRTKITKEWLEENHCKLERLVDRMETLAKLELCTGKKLNLDCLQFDFRENVVPARSECWNKRVYFEDYKEWRNHMTSAYVNYWDWLDYTRSAYGEAYHINSCTSIDHAMFLKATFIKHSRNFKNPKSMTDTELKAILEGVMGFDFIMRMINSVPSSVSIA